MDMNTYLERFIECEEAEYPLVDITTIMFVRKCIDNNYSLEKVKQEVIENKLSNRYTPILMLDFSAAEKDDLIKIIECYNGIYRFQLSDNDVPEENTLYAVFPDPVSAFQYSKKVFSIS